MYEPRYYRKYVKLQDLIQFNVIINESDLQIYAESNLKHIAQEAVIKYRLQIQEYAKTHPEFLTSLAPIKPEKFAPKIVKHMSYAAYKANVGPMAAVAGAISCYTAQSLFKYTNNIIIENGGDIYIKSDKDRKILINAGNSPLSNKIGLLIPGNSGPIGVCTSSGTVGHSLSFGKADAAVIVAKDSVLADATATAVCNLVKTDKDINKGIDFAMSINEIDGVLIIIGDKIGICGKILITDM